MIIISTKYDIWWRMRFCTLKHGEVLLRAMQKERLPF